jgi:hypothetical protein
VIGQDRVATPSLEYQIKSSLIYNFLKFIEWPNGVSSDQFIICYFPDDQQYSKSLLALQDKLVQGRHLIVEPLDGENMVRCDIVIESQSSATAMQTLLQRDIGKAVLTIGESDNFLRLGGIIRFVLVDGTVQFEINQARAEQQGLVISSKLLRLAQFVEQ